MERGALLGLALSVLLLTSGCLQAAPDAGNSVDGESELAPTPVAPTELPLRRLPSEQGVVIDPEFRENLQQIPWENVTVVVSVENEANPDRNITPMVADAIDYWEGPGAEHAAYTADFDLRPNATDADVEVRFVESVDCKQGYRAYIGCAPRLSPGSDVAGTQVVQVRSGYSDAATDRIVRHEFGHLVGLSHGSEPETLMQPEFEAAERPVTNATDRPFPWREQELMVYVNDGDLTPEKRAETIRQVAKAIDHYEYDTDRLPENRSLTLTNERERADIVVSFPEELDCNVQDGSCHEVSGYDPDIDPALEYYTHYHISISGVETEAVGWHVGYWLGHSLGAESTADLPATFRNASYEERRNWWREE